MRGLGLDLSAPSVSLFPFSFDGMTHPDRWAIGDPIVSPDFQREVGPRWPRDSGLVWPRNMAETIWQMFNSFRVEYNY